MISILVVEDESITAMDIKRSLEDLDYQVPAITNSGEEAILLAKKFHPDLVLMDIVLKGEMDGTAAAEYISSHYHIPIIFLTAYNDDNTFNRAKLSAPYGYITKPFGNRDLQIAIELALFKRSSEIKIFAAEERYRTVMERATCGIFIMDQNGIISEANEQARKIFGCSPEEIIGKNFRSFIPPTEQDYTDVQIQKLLIEKTIGPNKVHIQQSKGATFDVELSAVYVENGGEKFIFGILNDTTERNRLRAQTLLADKLATVGTLAAGIIHEINNPMTSISLNLDYFKDKLPSLQVSDPAQQQLQFKLTAAINDSIQGANKIKSIVQDLKKFARIDTEEIKAVDVHELLKTAINIAHPQYKTRAKLETHFSADIPLLLLSDTKLEQVFLNLIINATQAFDENNFHNNIIKITTQMDKNRIRIDIVDTGKGIPAHILPKIFDPFFTTKPVGIGTGLGLSICYDIIHHLGGEITVESDLEKGTKFSIYLPVQLKVATPNEVILPTSELARKKILVVDDDPTLLIVINRILEKYHDITVSDGRAALKLLVKQGEMYDAIITDLNMPDVNGIDLYRYVSKNYEGLENRMIFTTGGFYTSLMSDFIKSVKNPCLEKPFTPNQLRETIHKIFATS